MFRNLPVFTHEEKSLRALAAKMVSPREDEPTPEGEVDEEETTKPIPAGYTYLGQFIDHDLTFDPASMLDRQNDPDALTNFRSPRFDLDSVYGRGPADQPYLYDQSAGDPRLLLGGLVSSEPALAGPDVPRNAQGVALIGDPRNDENLIVSQLHSVVLRFHNTMTARIAAETGLLHDDLFKEVQRRVRWHYQWAAIHDFLPRVVGQAVLDAVLPAEEGTAPLPKGRTEPIRVPTPRLRFYRPRQSAYIPVEFSVAAYRFGHAMVRPIYRINAAVPRLPVFSDDFVPDSRANLNGFRPLPRDFGFDWRFFFELGGNPDGKPMQRAYRIDPRLVNPLGALPPRVAVNPSSLAERNLLRGLAMALPSGQTVARAMGLPPIPDRDLIVGEEEEPISQIASEFRDNAPLWYYILREAELEHEGNQLGPMGGRIVAEVFVGLLAADRLSYLSVEPTWKPDPSLARRAGGFGMPEIIRVATGAA